MAKQKFGTAWQQQQPYFEIADHSNPFYSYAPSNVNVLPTTQQNGTPPLVRNQQNCELNTATSHTSSNHGALVMVQPIPAFDWGGSIYGDSAYPSSPRDELQQLEGSSSLASMSSHSQVSSTRKSKKTSQHNNKKSKNGSSASNVDLSGIADDGQYAIQHESSTSHHRAITPVSTSSQEVALARINAHYQLMTHYGFLYSKLRLVLLLTALPQNACFFVPLMRDHRSQLHQAAEYALMISRSPHNPSESPIYRIIRRSKKSPQELMLRYLNAANYPSVLSHKRVAASHSSGGGAASTSNGTAGGCFVPFFPSVGEDHVQFIYGTPYTDPLVLQRKQSSIFSTKLSNRSFRLEGSCVKSQSSKKMRRQNGGSPARISLVLELEKSLAKISVLWQKHITTTSTGKDDSTQTKEWSKSIELDDVDSILSTVLLSSVKDTTMFCP